MLVRLSKSSKRELCNTKTDLAVPHRKLPFGQGRDNTTGEKLTIQGKQIQSENAVRLLGVKIDHRLTFGDHIPIYVEKPLRS